MSDKETAPRLKEQLKTIQKELHAALLSSRRDWTCKHMFKASEVLDAIIAAECTAPAPQPDWKKEALALVVLLRAKCNDEEWANLESSFAASPQVTPPRFICVHGNFAGRSCTLCHGWSQPTSGQAESVTKFPVYKITLICKDTMPTDFKYIQEQLEGEVRRVIKEELMLNVTFFSVEEQKGE